MSRLFFLKVNKSKLVIRRGHNLCFSMRPRNETPFTVFGIYSSKKKVFQFLRLSFTIRERKAWWGRDEKSDLLNSYHVVQFSKCAQEKAQSNKRAGSFFSLTLLDLTFFAPLKVFSDFNMTKKGENDHLKISRDLRMGKNFNSKIVEKKKKSGG